MMLRLRDVALLGMALAIVAVFAAVMFGLPATWSNKTWVVKWIEVQGPFERVSIEQIRAAAVPAMGQTFVATDLSEVKRQVESLAWIRSAGVRRKWPDTLQIRVLEHEPVARWGERQLLSDLGEVFAAEGNVVMQGLPLLHGPEGSVNEVQQVFGQIVTLFAESDVMLSELSLSARGSWSVDLDNGVSIVMGSSNPMARLERFLVAEPLIQSDESRRMKSADLRYPNGFSVRWDDPQKQQLTMTTRESD